MIPENSIWRATGLTLGEGGQGRVYQVEKKANPGAYYAMKVLVPGKPKKAYERFQREIEAIKKLEHPNIVRIIDHSVSDSDFNYYVMEFIPHATSLKKKIGLGDNPFYKNAQTSLDLFRMILSALQACERSGIVHRDLSPENILLLPDRTIKIIDFGVCQQSESGTITLTDEGVGTPNYMAPECESYGGGDVGIAADIYSAAKVLWSMVTGRNAFARETPVFTQYSMQAVFPDAIELWHLQHIFDNAIRLDVSNRWKSTQDALNACNKIDRLIRLGFLPLEALQHICPICGWGALRQDKEGYIIFGNPNPSGVRSLRCDYCGVCMAVDFNTFQQIIDNRKRFA